MKLNVAGMFTNDGVVKCTPSYDGAGGSIWIVADRLTGTGSICADGMRRGGGGRVALYYNDWGYEGSVSAYAGIVAPPRAAGTVYTRAAAQIYGDLIVDNNNADQSTNTTTTLNDLESVSYVFDNITVKGKAVLEIGPDDSLMLASGGVYSNSEDSLLIVDEGGAFTNAGTFILAGTGTAVSVSGTFTNLGGSTFRYIGTAAGVDPVYVRNDIEYSSLDIAGPGQTFLWTAGETYTVYGTFSAFGESGNLVTLRSTSDGAYWYLHLAGNDMGRARYVRVKDSNAGSGRIVHVYPEDESVNEGHTVNWRFGPFAGTVISAW